MVAEGVKVMLLPSVDGDEWTQAVIPPAGISDDAAVALFVRVADEVKLTKPNEWNYTDLEVALTKVGFTACEVIHGPWWD